MTTADLSQVVKICGIRSLEAAMVASQSGADMIGFVFAQVRRQIGAADARAIGEALRNSSRQRSKTVGLFVGATADFVNETAEAAGLDLVQLHGDLDPLTLPAVEFPVLRAVRTEPGRSFESIRSELEGLAQSARPPIGYLVDGFHPAQHGGMGAQADWDLAARLAEVFPVILAGGLTAENVGEAIALVQPLGVDVSSGVETDGEKDQAKITAFALSARSAFETTARR